MSQKFLISVNVQMEVEADTVQDAYIISQQLDFHQDGVDVQDRDTLRIWDDNGNDCEYNPERNSLGDLSRGYYIFNPPKKIYISEKYGSLMALDQHDNLLFSGLSADGVQSLDFDDRGLVDEFDSDTDKAEDARIKKLLSD